MNTENNDKTIFEKIVAGEIPCYKLYEDENTFAFLDISPNTKGHSLVITKKPYKNIYEINDTDAENLIKSVKKVATALKKILNADGINIVMNNEEPAGQIVFHVHIHVIPRFKNDDGYHGVKYKYKEGEAEAISEKVSEELKTLN
ncbi:HIT family protein [Candidatus Parcubacteria bacterium]|nr:HIT family protein [Candidatus Parcubacteria bacterium]